MSYRNDQFYGQAVGATFDDTSGGRGKYNWYNFDSDNPRFIYPDRTVRTYETQKVAIQGGRGPGDIRYVDQIVSKREVLKRGFMRSISRTSDEPIKKVQFQFNPQTITQNVSMTEGLLNFFQQDPGQYAQPMAGNTDMSFTLMFDRTMEINNPIGRSSYVSPTSGSGFTEGSVSPNSRNPWETGDPQYVGVLRDIAALYGVIGQGVSDADVQGRIAELQAAIKAETLGEDLDVEDINEGLEKIQTVLEVNNGNYALLVPRPVRVVLSSLYMVEGFVTSTSVTFTKFNTAFVPIQAVVNITMRAMHIGFSKKDTFLTYSLAEAEKIAIADKREEQVENRDIYIKAQEDLANFSFQVLTNDVLSPPGRPQIWEDGFDDFVDQFQLELTAFGPGSKSLDNVKDLMKEGATLKVWAEWKFFTNIPNPGDPIGSEKIAPKAFHQKLWTMTTTSDIDDRGEEGSGGVFLSESKPIRKFTPSPEFGGACRVIYTVKVELIHKGQEIQGNGWATENANNDSDFWDLLPFITEIPMSWSYFGDQINLSGTNAPVGSGIPE